MLSAKRENGAHQHQSPSGIVVFACRFLVVNKGHVEAEGAQHVDKADKHDRQRDQAKIFRDQDAEQRTMVLIRPRSLTTKRIRIIQADLTGTR